MVVKYRIFAPGLLLGIEKLKIPTTFPKCMFYNIDILCKVKYIHPTLSDSSDVGQRSDTEIHPYLKM